MSESYEPNRLDAVLDMYRENAHMWESIVARIEGSEEATLRELLARIGALDDALR